MRIDPDPTVFQAVGARGGYKREHLTDTERLKSEIVATFRPFGPEKIVLFGSFAPGDWGEGSDIDVFVVYRTTKRFLDRLEELYLAWELPIGVDILAYTPEEFARMLEESAFVQDAVAEGMVLYERH